MVIHAENEKQKKLTALHISTGAVCKNCKNFSKSVVFPDRGYCHFFDKPGLCYNDYCSLFKK